VTRRPYHVQMAAYDDGYESCRVLPRGPALPGSKRLPLYSKVAIVGFKMTELRVQRCAPRNALSHRTRRARRRQSSGSHSPAMRAPLPSPPLGLQPAPPPPAAYPTYHAGSASTPPLSTQTTFEKVAQPPPPPSPLSDCSVPVGAAPAPGAQGDYLGSAAGDAAGVRGRGSLVQLALGVVAGFMLGPFGFLFLCGGCATLCGEEPERAGNRRKFLWGCVLGTVLGLGLGMIFYQYRWTATGSAPDARNCFYDALGGVICV
jgi:hypothetical protein